RLNNPRQAGQGAMGGKLRERLALADELGDARAPLQHVQQNPRDFQDHRADALPDQWGIPNELDRVPQPLFRVEENGAVRQRFPGPFRWGERPFFQAVAVPAAFVLAPTLVEVALAE